MDKSSALPPDFSASTDQALREAVAGLLQAAQAHHQSGRLADAEALYRQALRMQPRDADALHLLGLIAFQREDLKTATDFIGRALKINSGHAMYHSNLGLVLRAQGRLPEAIAAFSEALRLCPAFIDAHYNLGLALQAESRFDEAIESYRRALALRPNFAEAHNNVGSASLAAGRAAEALAHFRQAISLRPNLAEAFSNLGVALKDLGEIDQAIAAQRRALNLNPHYPEAHNNLGVALMAARQHAQATESFGHALVSRENYAEAQNNLGLALLALDRDNEAIDMFRAAGKSNPRYGEAHCNLGRALLTLGDFAGAAAAFSRALDVKESEPAKSGFATAIRRVRFNKDDPAMRLRLTRAISEVWGRPIDLSPAAISLIKCQDRIGDAIAACDAAWPRQLDALHLLGLQGGHAPADTGLLLTVLTHAPIVDLALERYLTSVRRVLLLNALEDGPATAGPLPLPFCAALAQQCFNNEYVFSVGNEEMAQAMSLQASLQASLTSGQAFPPAWLPVVASYFPLGELDGATSLQSRFSLGDTAEMGQLINQQVIDPALQRATQNTIALLTPVQDEVSVLVREQYEEHPYPRWAKSSAPPLWASVPDFIRKQFPGAPYRQGREKPPDILIAGCGTGQHSIQTARQFPDAKVLAIDLSATSLAYAIHKTRELGVANLEYAQADIVALEPFGRSFDLIESVGVLHHLADPTAGWRRLLTLLHPDGVMRIALYSETARRGIVLARRFIAEQGFGGSAADIRRCREIMTSPENIDRFSQVFSFHDFYSTSECRDLLFHVHELRFTIPQLGDVFDKLDLQFLGWILPTHVLAAYARQFPADESATNMENWHIFEQENPDTFGAMYHFFVQPRI